MSSKKKTSVTKEDGKAALVPELRFPEFREAEGWAQKRLFDAADHSVKWSFIGGPFGSNLKSSDYVPDGVRIIQLQNIGDGEFFDDYRIFTTPEKADELLSNNIYPGEIIMSKMGDPVGRACLIPEGQDRYVMCSDGIRLVVDEKKNNKYFLYSLINAPQFRNLIEKTATGSTRKRIGLDELKSLPMRLPKRAEQQKIAECLSSVDEVIAAQARKVDALKTHKKGLMQQLFPREGETQPRLRFPEFRNDGKWARTTIGDLNPFVTSGSRGWAAFYADKGDLFVRITNLWRDSIYLDLTDSKFVQLPPGANEGVRTQLKEHDVLISITADIGIVGYVDKSVRSPAYINQHIALVRFGEGKLCGKFVAYFLASEESQKIFRASTDNGAKAGMNLIGIQNIRLMLPSVPEQHRIASCLSSLDALITGETQMLETLKRHKRGLVQRLFAAPEEADA